MFYERGYEEKNVEPDAQSLWFLPQSLGLTVILYFTKSHNLDCFH